MSGDFSTKDTTFRLVIPGVELGDLLGQGSFGAVYSGHHQTLDVDVAVKVIESRAGQNFDSALNEARLMARLDHPNLLRIYDAGRSGDFVYLVVELMDGGSCFDIRNAEPNRLLDLTRQLLSGLQALHDARIVHRDIKPANCLLRKHDGRVKLADLGIALEQATRSGGVKDVAGTLPFMAPELFDRSPQFGVASDLYALGMSLACMLLENDPFPQGTFSEMISWVKNEQRPKFEWTRTDVPSSITGFIDRLIAHHPENRPNSAGTALSWLSNAAMINISSPSTRAQPSSAGERVGPWMLGEIIYRSLNWHTYSATHSTTGVPARIALLQPAGALSRSNKLILESAERAAHLEHPGILDMLDWGIKNGLAYIVTSPRGITVQDLVGGHGPCDELETVEFALTLADALSYLHSQGLVYQLVEPSSIVISPDARSVQLGWPLFCVPIGSSVIGPDGKPRRVLIERFTAPEATSPASDTIEPSVDMYGLGVVMYYMLVGDPGIVSEAVERAIRQGKGPHVRADAEFVTAPTTKLISALMNPDPDGRPANAGDVRDELARIRRRLRGNARTVSREYLT